jgi:hypothetical protein
VKPTDLELAQACADTYDPAARWDQSWTREHVHVGLRHAGDHDIVAFRGSIDEIDWIRDFNGWPSKHAVLGYCHSGFLAGMGTVASELSQAITPERPYALTGHSLGAARALIAAGLLTAAKTPPVLVVTFGTPRPGMAQLTRILNTGGYFIKCYKNGPDPVAEVPVRLAPLWLYQKPVIDTPIEVAPADDAHDPFHWHHMPLYLEGVRRMLAA